MDHPGGVLVESGVPERRAAVRLPRVLICGFAGRPDQMDLGWGVRGPGQLLFPGCTGSTGIHQPNLAAGVVTRRDDPVAVGFSDGGDRGVGPARDTCTPDHDNGGGQHSHSITHVPPVSRIEPGAYSAHRRSACRAACRSETCAAPWRISRRRGPLDLRRPESRSSAVDRSITQRPGASTSVSLARCSRWSGVAGRAGPLDRSVGQATRPPAGFVLDQSLMCLLCRVQRPLVLHDQHRVLADTRPIGVHRRADGCDAHADIRRLPEAATGYAAWRLLLVVMMSVVHSDLHARLGRLVGVWQCGRIARCPLRTRTRPRPLWFADLITLMAPGVGEDRLRGEVLSQTDCHGVLRFRVSRRGRLVRVRRPVRSGDLHRRAGHGVVSQRARRTRRRAAPW